MGRILILVKKLDSYSPTFSAYGDLRDRAQSARAPRIFVYSRTCSFNFPSGRRRKEDRDTGSLVSCGIHDI